MFWCFDALDVLMFWYFDVIDVLMFLMFWCFWCLSALVLVSSSLFADRSLSIAVILSVSTVFSPSLFSAHHLVSFQRCHPFFFHSPLLIVVILGAATFSWKLGFSTAPWNFFWIWNSWNSFGIWSASPKQQLVRGTDHTSVTEQVGSSEYVGGRVGFGLWPSSNSPLYPGY